MKQVSIFLPFSSGSVVRNSAGSQVVPAVQEDHSKYAYTFGITAVGFFIVVMAVVPFWYVIKRRRSGSYDANAPAGTVLNFVIFVVLQNSVPL